MQLDSKLERSEAPPAMGAPPGPARATKAAAIIMIRVITMIVMIIIQVSLSLRPLSPPSEAPTVTR